MKLITLSPVFYERYRGCEEILIKQTRPYLRMAVYQFKHTDHRAGRIQYIERERCTDHQRNAEIPDCVQECREVSG